jgi:hypothetical protein
MSRLSPTTSKEVIGEGVGCHQAFSTVARLAAFLRRLGATASAGAQGGRTRSCSTKGDTRCLFRSTLWTAGVEHNLAAKLGDTTWQAMVRLALWCSLS